MTTTHAITQPRTRVRKVLRALSVGGILLAVIGVVSHFAWKNSGSNTWKLEIAKNGIEVYSLKAPGVSLKQFRAVTRVNTTVTRAVAAMRDTGAAACADWLPGCASDQIVDPWNTRELYEVHLWHMNFPRPLTHREFLLKTLFTPEPPNKTVRVEFVALPDRLPRNACCFRVSDMHNSWRFTATGENEIEVESVQNMDVGLPYFLYNAAAPQGIYQLFRKLPALLNKEKYRDAKFEFLDAAW